MVRPGEVAAFVLDGDDSGVAESALGSLSLVVGGRSGVAPGADERGQAQSISWATTTPAFPSTIGEEKG